MTKKTIKKGLVLFSVFLMSSVLLLSCALLDSLDNPFSFAEAVVDTVDPLVDAAEPIQNEEAYYIGREVASIILGNYKLYRDRELERYLNLICMTLVINSERPEIYNGYHVGILDTDEINAFATSGGHILITRGLLSCANSEDALAGVIAHEIGHIQLEHGIKAIKADRFTSAAVESTSNASFGSNKSEFASFVTQASESIATTMVNSGYSKNQEYAADKFAVKLMAEAGYDPEAMCEMLSIMHEKQKHDSRGFGKTHPSAKSRIRKVKRTARDLSGFYERDSREKRYSKFKFK